MAKRSERPAATGTVEPAVPSGNVLLLAPGIGHAERRACAATFSRHALDLTNAIHVVYGESAGRRHERMERHLPHHPADSVVVEVGPSGDVVHERRAHSNAEYRVERVPDPADLTGLGMALEDCLGEWRGDGGEIGVCVDSLSILLQYVPVAKAYRFLDAFTARLAEVGATGHFHLDPGAHDDRTVARLRSLFDGAVDVT